MCRILLGVEQRVVGGQHGAARNAEHHVDADLLQGHDQRLGAGDPRLDRRPRRRSRRPDPWRQAAPWRAARWPAGRRGLGRARGLPFCGAGCWLRRGRLRRGVTAAVAPAGAVLPSEGLSSPGCPAGTERAPWEGLGCSARSSGGFLVTSVRRGLVPHGALKNPSCRAAVEGRAQELDWSALLRASQVRGCGSASRVPPSPTSRPPRQIITAAVSLSETPCPEVFATRRGRPASPCR